MQQLSVDPIQIPAKAQTAFRPPARMPKPDPLDLLSDADRDLFLKFGWGPKAAPRFPTILQGFAHFASLQPEAIAAEYDGQTLTYGALDAASNRLAHLLAQQGVRRGEVVCLYLHRSFEMLIGLLAAMKVGAAYAPQHVGVATPETLRHIAQITEAKVILTLRAHRDAVPSDGQAVICIDAILDDDNPATTDDITPPIGPKFALRPDDRAIVLFTSGTTGVPNGVQVTHRNLCNILQTAPGDLGMRPGVRVGQILSIAFDMAAWETLGALSNGATLVIRGPSIAETAARVDILIATPSILTALDADHCRNVRVAAVAGEPCPRPLADRWGAFATFYNSCGPTETTIINTAAIHSPGKPVLSIGAPTPNNTVYILDDTLNPLPIGAKGEMWAGGDCVTPGYLGNPALTADRYRPDPFRPGKMMFRTRDLGRWTDDGELEHFGRVDDLVKIRGFRVELDGVSAALEAVAGCDQAVTLKFDDRNLVSFIAPATASPEAAAQSAAAKLPYYHVPSLILAMDELPRTPRGKLDKRQLLSFAATEIARNGVELA